MSTLTERLLANVQLGSTGMRMSFLLSLAAVGRRRVLVWTHDVQIWDRQLERVAYHVGGTSIVPYIVDCFRGMTDVREQRVTLAALVHCLALVGVQGGIIRVRDDGAPRPAWAYVSRVIRCALPACITSHLSLMRAATTADLPTFSDLVGEFHSYAGESPNPLYVYFRHSFTQVDWLFIVWGLEHRHQATLAQRTLATSKLGPDLARFVAGFLLGGRTFRNG